MTKTSNVFFCLWCSTTLCPTYIFFLLNVLQNMFCSTFTNYGDKIRVATYESRQTNEKEVLKKCNKCMPTAHCSPLTIHYPLAPMKELKKFMKCISTCLKQKCQQLNHCDLSRSCSFYQHYKVYSFKSRSLKTCTKHILIVDYTAPESMRTTFIGFFELKSTQFDKTKAITMQTKS